METAKVDIRKLQVLNDRINQCIDALNQVRLSVHGLTGTQSPAGINPAAVGLSHSSFGQTPFAGMGIPNPASYGQAGLGSPYGAFAPFTPGIAHTTPFSQQQIGGAFGNANPFSGFSPEAYEASLRPVWSDPLLTARIQQTFPYAQLPVPPVVTIY